MRNEARKTLLTLARPTHVDLYVENYDLLRRWAVKFTENDLERAEDLLHDLFIQFTLARPDLDQIQSLESYLYVVMRNLHLSQVRRAARAPIRSLSAVEYDTGDVSLWWSDPRDRLKMREELVTVCQYACFRRHSSKAGSILILRFFLGYYPEEIALVLHSSRTAVDNRLSLARAEAKTYLFEPDRLHIIGAEKLTKLTASDIGEDLMAGLRRQIFKSVTGECLDKKSIEKLYGRGSGTVITQTTLAHIVSCEKCLDEVNDMLEIPRLAERYPLDTVGKDPKNKDGGGSGSGPGGGNMLDDHLLRREALYRHRPEEISVMVNGHLQTSHRVAGSKNEFSVVVDMFENLGFVEVFSEQGMRLLMLNVEAPPTGEAKQSAVMELSDGRTVSANLSFGGSFPTLQVAYDDPSIGAEVLATELSEAPNVLSSPPSKGGGDAASADGVVVSAADRGGSPFPTLEGKTGFDWREWFSPMRLAFASTILVGVLAAIWFVSLPTSPEPLVARTVLKQARDAEFAIAPTADRVLHRNYQVEEWANGSLRSRQRVDEWQQKTVNARRSYDEKGQMVAGVWTRADGSQQVFTQGERLRTVRTGSGSDRVLAPEPTANAFANLIDRHGVTNRVTVEETAAQYVFSFEDRNGETEQKGISERLLAASLTIDRNTYNPVSQAITIQVGNEIREYRFSDVRVEQKPLSDVSPLIFQPEAELAKGATKVTKPILSEPGAVATGSETVITPATATLDTEVEVFRALDSVNALSGDQISVTRTTSGQLKVSGIVDSNQRKTEILNALNAVKNSPGLTIDVQTAEEVARRMKPSGTVQPIELDSSKTANERRLPVEDELKAHFERRGVAGDGLNSQINQYAGAVLHRSDSLRRNALSLKQLAERFSPAELERLDAAKRDQWKALLRSKAAAIAGDVRSLQNQLSTIGLGSARDGGSGGADIRDASDISKAAQRLFGLAAECDSQVRQSFSVSAGGTASVKTVQFWRNLGQMSAIAADVQKF